MIKTGKIKTEKPLPEIAEDEVLFDIPGTWCWVRLADLVEIYTGKKDANFGSPDGQYDFFTCSNQPIKCKSYSYDGEYLIMPGNGANIGMVMHYQGKFEAYQRTYLLENTYGIFMKYLKHHLESNWKQYNADKMYGSAIPYIKLGNLTNYCVALPPLAEQKRIVAKLEEILPLIDRYETAWNKLEEFNKRFHVDMQKSILQLAIQGKLVEQRPEEGTGEELFQQIQAEKQALIKAGKIKKEKPLPEIVDDEIPFDIPDTWKWVRFGAVVKKLTDGSHNPPPNSGHGYPVISAKNVKNGLITFDNVDRYTDETGFLKENPRTNIIKGDIIMGIIGGSIGNIAVYTHEEKVIAQRSIAIIGSMIDTDYCVSVLKSPLMQNAMQASAAGSAQGGVYLGTLSNFLLPLPPLAEQKRMVSKLEEILPLCDWLK